MVDEVIRFLLPSDRRMLSCPVPAGTECKRRVYRIGDEDVVLCPIRVTQYIAPGAARFSTSHCLDVDVIRRR